MEVTWLCRSHYSEANADANFAATMKAFSVRDVIYKRPDAAYMTLKEAGAQLGVHRATLMRWIEMGKIAAIQPAGPRGMILIPKA